MTDFAGVDVGVTEDGIWARGDLGAFELGPLVWQDAALDLTATREAQHLMVNGEVEMFGSRQLVDLSLSREEFSFRSETNLFDMFTADITAHSPFDLRRPDFQVHAVARADFADAVGPMAQDAMVAFAERGQNVVATAASAARAAGEALARTEASAEDLRRVLEAQRRQAEDQLAAARTRAASARSAMVTALGARNRALSAYHATPRLPAWRKLQRLNAYRSAHGLYIRRSVAFNAAAAEAAVRQRVVAAIPPVDRNVLMQSADAAIRELRGQLEGMQRDLEQMEAQLAAITDALDRGEQLLVIDRAEFRGGLQAAMAGQAMRWDINGRFVGEPFELHETIDFSSPGEGSARMLQALLGT